MSARNTAESAPLRLTPRSAATRATLISVAERLFADKGVDGVTLHEIGKAAGQRNAAVCQYHFGNKEGLLQAIIDKHVPGIVARRHDLLDHIEQKDAMSVRDVVRAFVQPVAEKLADLDGGRDFVVLNAQLLAIHTVSVQQLGTSPLKLPATDRFSRTLTRALAPLGLPKAVLMQRMLLAAVLLFHGLADHSRMLETANKQNPTMDTNLFVNTLQEGIEALLSSPATLLPRNTEWQPS